jgi:hypothetical protein
LPVAVTVAIAVAVAVPISIAVPIPDAVALSTPSYYDWLLCVGQRGLDIMDITIASRIVIVIIIITLPSPAEKWRAETCKGGRGGGGNFLGGNTVPLPCCGRAGKVSESLSTTSLKTVFFCKNGQSYKKNKNW